MARMIFISGGCRSGKSKFALEQAGKEEGEKIFLATCPNIDEEMNSRIERHKQERKGWRTIEEEIELSQIFSDLPPGSVIILDCLSLWINNLMYRSSGSLTQDEVQALSLNLANSIQASNAKSVFIVTNEVGMGLVPENREGRTFRDLLGICNQAIALSSQEAYFLVSGLSISLKPKPENAI
ncbi:bifunctional adenosylcobinamide kinase/adenosylcobinamide-phosphate guanylyltransferase [Leptospira semungkisensis]|uniref:Adenosylcobinamide kinase n=1 Tax=Leptospira semungkisensis TaxID=2484985 RepID=A0A4R9FM95_9LEPT|nr:bifunctional adenosylcobinamide kinase/adenosylcobinamide-phosphate guanylyltransferase [Leptospira semungkisensis]TGJ99482.1 bifunctional adenosylcobinamide kinase/adenosylcobinamide-phosphate guanylyltransferase [Leptospira semungkisensis]